MDKRQMSAALESLSEWLSDKERLGAAPAAIECAGEFDLDGLRYYIFKFRRALEGEWLIGISGGYKAGSLTNCGHIFSEMDPYVERTARESGVMMAQFIRDFMREKNSEERERRERVNRLFSGNCEYVSKTSLNVEEIAGQFIKSETRAHLTVGMVDIPSGKVVISDPLCYLAMGICCPVLKESIPAGSYPAEVAVVRNKDVGIRMCTARLKIKPDPAVYYAIAESVESNAVMLKGWVMSGFPVETGVMSFCDAEGAKEFKKFTDKWQSDNAEKNIVSDYFSGFFAESAARYPEHQNKNGDFIEWKNPDSGKRMVMISSGLGDGFYQCYWGYDEFGDICELVVPMIDSKLLE